ncbi:MAG: DnaJ C-terminal domain-containing protein [Rugosibacter sp.]|nr:DnaJ C-terminal domain-containing protein [Rugosibacter sp.]
MMATDSAYAELGLGPDATETEVKAAWRRLVSKWHPDRNDSVIAVSMMQRINRAFEVIRLAGFQGDVAAKKPSSTASKASRGNAQAASTPRHVISRKVSLSLEEAALGCIKTLQGKLPNACASCDGVGSTVLSSACAECDGHGTARQRMWYGWKPSKMACQACQGTGLGRCVCVSCGGRGQTGPDTYKLPVRIPQGVRDGDFLHVDSRGSDASPASFALDLRITLSPHPFFVLDDDGTIHCDVPVDGFAWIAGRSIDVPTLGGLRSVTLSPDQTSYSLPGQGFPITRRGPRGDQIVRVRPVFPERLTTDQRILLDQLVATTVRPGGEQATDAVSMWGRTVQDWLKGRE